MTVNESSSSPTAVADTVTVVADTVTTVADTVTVVADTATVVADTVTVVADTATVVADTVTNANTACANSGVQRKTGPKAPNEALSQLYLPGKLYTLLENPQNTFIEWKDDHIFQIKDFEALRWALGGKPSVESLKEDLRKHEFYQCHRKGFCLYQHYVSIHLCRNTWTHRDHLFQRGQKEAALSIRRRQPKSKRCCETAVPDSYGNIPAVKRQATVPVCNGFDQDTLVKLLTMRQDLYQRVGDLQRQLAEVDDMLGLTNE